MCGSSGEPTRRKRGRRRVGSVGGPKCVSSVAGNVRRAACGVTHFVPRAMVSVQAVRANGGSMSERPSIAQMNAMFQGRRPRGKAAKMTFHRKKRHMDDDDDEEEKYAEPRDAQALACLRPTRAHVHERGSRGHMQTADHRLWCSHTVSCASVRSPKPKLESSKLSIFFRHDKAR